MPCGVRVRVHACLAACLDALRPAMLAGWRVSVRREDQAGRIRAVRLGCYYHAAPLRRTIRGGKTHAAYPACREVGAGLAVMRSPSAFVRFNRPCGKNKNSLSLFFSKNSVDGVREV